MQVNGYQKSVSLLVPLHGHVRPRDIKIPAGMDVDTFEPDNPEVQRVLIDYKSKSKYDVENASHRSLVDFQLRIL